MSRSAGITGRRRLLLFVAASVAAHAAVLPVACYLLLVAGPLSSEGRPLLASLEEEARIEPPEAVPILEPSQQPASRQPAGRVLPPPPDFRPLWERPSVAPLSVRFPVEPVSQQAAPRRSDAHGLGHAEGADRDLGEGAGGSRPEGTPDLGAMPGPREEALSWPDRPPASLFESLPPGGLRTADMEPLFDSDSRERMVRKVYSLSRYPREALEAESEGTVSVRFRIDRGGRACDVQALPTSEELHPSLAEEAVRMVEAGAPYPLPPLRNAVDMFVAVAWRNTPEVKGDRVVVVVSSGDESVDARASDLAAQDSGLEAQPGWHLSAWSVRAVADMAVEGAGAGGVSFVSYEGDERFRSTLERIVAQRIGHADKTGYLRIPIRFRIQPD
ncbi:MAG: TonB family protein [Deltaproteobacteria bacterium]|nr:TonB family protein [Deltaproteobacteria bacterium]